MNHYYIYRVQVCLPFELPLKWKIRMDNIVRTVISKVSEQVVHEYLRHGKSVFVDSMAMEDD